VGALEAKIAFDAGANWMTLIGCAPLITVKEAVGEAASRENCAALVELTGIRDIMERVAEWRGVGVQRVVYHRGWDEGNVGGRLWGDADLQLIRDLSEAGMKVSVAGGLNLEVLERFNGVPVSVFVIGRAIRETPDPAATARLYREAIAKLS